MKRYYCDKCNVEQKFKDITTLQLVKITGEFGVTNKAEIELTREFCILCYNKIKYDFASTRVIL